MSFTIHCFEPHGIPRQASLTLEKPGAFAIYALQDFLTEDARSLRTTVIRREGQDPPANAVLVMEMEIRSARRGELPVVRVRRVGGSVVLEVVRPDSRGRVTPAAEFKSGSRFEATLRDLRTIEFNLEVESDSATSAKNAIGSSRANHSQAVASLGNLFWVVPNVSETIREPMSKVIAGAQGLAKKMGLSRQSVSIFMTMIPMIGLGGAAAYMWFQKNAVEEENERLVIEVADHKAARAAAVDAEQLCREQRQELALKLDEIHQNRVLAAESALSPTMAKSVAMEVGGSVFSQPVVLDIDALYYKGLHKRVVAKVAENTEFEATPEVCLGQIDALGQTLPEAMLMYHPSEDQICPQDYAAVEGGVDRAGPWGISSRVAKEFGPPVTDGDSGDMRLNERWAATTYVAALQEVMDNLLQADTGERPVVSPTQLHAWTLAIYHAYNSLPSPGDGAQDLPAKECVREILVAASEKYQLAEPGQPILPDITVVEKGKGFTVTPSQGCRWPADAIVSGAKAAVRAASNTASFQLHLQELATEG